MRHIFLVVIAFALTSAANADAKLADLLNSKQSRSRYGKVIMGYQNDALTYDKGYVTRLENNILTITRNRENKKSTTLQIDLSKRGNQPLYSKGENPMLKYGRVIKSVMARVNSASDQKIDLTLVAKIATKGRDNAALVLEVPASLEVDTCDVTVNSWDYNNPVPKNIKLTSYPKSEKTDGHMAPCIKVSVAGTADVSGFHVTSNNEFKGAFMSAVGNVVLDVMFKVLLSYENNKYFIPHSAIL